MTTSIQLQTFVANARKSVRDRENVSIGGGIFNAQEMSVVVQGMEALGKAQSALLEISELLKKHPEFSRGNSTVHFSVHRALSALSAIPTDKPDRAQTLQCPEQKNAEQALASINKTSAKNKPAKNKP